MFSVDVHMTRDASWLKDALWCAKEHVRSATHVLRTRYGGGAVIVASRKIGTVNLVVSRKSGGAVRAPGNACGKRVKRKRGSRSAAAVAARIERWYLKRTRTAGGTACVNSNVDSSGTGTDGGSTTTREGGDDTYTRKIKTRTVSAEHDKHARTARAGRSGRHVGDWQARPVRRRSDEVRGLVVQTEIVPRSRGSAVSARVDDDRDVVDTETQRNPRQRRKFTQHTDVLHSGDDNCRNRVGQVSQGRRERGVRGLEAVRHGMGAQASDEVCGTRCERAGVQIPRQHSNQAGRENRAIGVTMLGMEDMRVNEHLTRNSVRITSWNQMREEILEITRTEQYIDSQPLPMQLGANPKSKGKGKDSKGKGKGKGKGKDVMGKDKAKDAKNESSMKAKSDDQRKCFYCQKTGHVKAECRKRLKDLADTEEKPMAATPHPNDTAAVVPLQC